MGMLETMLISTVFIIKLIQIIFILFNIFVIVTGIITLVLGIKRVVYKEKSRFQQVITTVFIIATLMLIQLWGIIIYLMNR